MNNKEIAVEFLKLAASGKIKEAYEKHVHPSFMHHNPYFKGDGESLKDAMEEAHTKSPNEFLKVVHVLEDAGLVATYSHVKQKKGNDIAVVHMFRFKYGKIVELWDVGMIVPKDSPNKNGVF